MRSGNEPVDPNCGVSPTFGRPLLDFQKAPFLIIWEVTQACDLACVHCRADAMPRRNTGELSLDEARTLFLEARSMGTRLVVLTGGDPLKRPDINELISAAKETGMVPSLSPSVTPLLTPAVLEEGKRAGLHSVSLSLDGASSGTHDSFRGVPGAFDRTMELAGSVVSNNLELRINTTITRTNVDELETIAQLVDKMNARFWSVFFLVPTGRAGNDMQIPADKCEEVLRWLYRLSSKAPFRIKTTEAPHYRRIVLEEMSQESGIPVNLLAATARSGKGRYLPGINDGRGFAFISHRGDVFPSGFFPLSAGNLREHSFEKIYQDSDLFRELRDPDLLHGRCGICSYRELCGGSRARAFAATGDPLGDDPLCEYNGGFNTWTR